VDSWLIRLRFRQGLEPIPAQSPVLGSNLPFVSTCPPFSRISLFMALKLTARGGGV